MQELEREERALSEGKGNQMEGRDKNDESEQMFLFFTVFYKVTMLILSF